MPAMAALDDLWDFDDPAASGARFLGAIEIAQAEGDPTAADEARTQVARALGLQGQFDEGHAVLDQVDLDHPAEDRVRVRARLERGRLLRSGGDPAASVTPFAAAWELAPTLGEDGLAVDAAHMLALVDAPPGEGAWHQRALDLAGTSPDPAARRWRGSLWNNIGWARFEAGDLDGALAAFETALAARHEQDKPKETRVAEWCVARCLRALGRPAEALVIHERLAVETAAAGDPQDGYGAEEIGECLLVMGREKEARTSPIGSPASADSVRSDPGRQRAPPDRYFAISQMWPPGSTKLAVRMPHGRSTGPLSSLTPRLTSSSHIASTSSTAMVI
jgi:tetratricopeptide (TPR) repeat protein